MTTPSSNNNNSEEEVVLAAEQQQQQRHVDDQIRFIDEIEEDDEDYHKMNVPPVDTNIKDTATTSTINNEDTNTNNNNEDHILSMEEWLRQQEEEIEFVADNNEEQHQEEEKNDDDIVHEDEDEEEVVVERAPVEPVAQLAPPQAPFMVDNEDIDIQQQQQIMMEIDIQQQQRQHQQTTSSSTKKRYSTLFTYRPISFLSFFCLVWYALRTRKQYYFAIIYLCHSKFAYVIFGNTIIATAIVIFDCMIYLFFRSSSSTNTNTNTNQQQQQHRGLRIQEAEGLQDFFRWNVTETCLALTMFRYELNIITLIQFVFIILLKCLHYVAAIREQHLRMTEDVIINNMTTDIHTTTFDETNNNDTTNNNNDTNTNDQQRKKPRMNLSSYFSSLLFIRSNHISIISFFIVLQFIDMYIIQQSILQILQYGPSVKILFAFEAAILLVSTWCHLVLWNLHFIDCIIQYGHDIKEWYIASKLLHPWKEYKATLIFAVELQAQAINFLFYTTFFCIVLTFYGLPINLFREVYMSFMKLKERLTSFFHYRQLMASMNRFKTATDDELIDVGRTCIICRDEMTSGMDCKRLPICLHTFHKSCLREWLVQQQSCPTCRADIAAMEALEASRTATANAATQRTTTTTPANTNVEANTTETTTTTTTTTTSNGEHVTPPPNSSETTSAAVETPSRDLDTANAIKNHHNETIIPFYSSSTVRNTQIDNSSSIGVIQAITPTLYEVIGAPGKPINEHGVPIYSNDSIVFTTSTTFTPVSTPIPIRTIQSHKLIVGMATYTKHQPIDFSNIDQKDSSSSRTAITYIQLPDQTWICQDHVQPIYVIQNYNK